MKRRLFNLLAGLSLLLFVATTIVFYEIQFKHDATISYEAKRLYTVRFQEGGIDFGIYRYRIRANNFTRTWHFLGTSDGDSWPFSDAPKWKLGWYTWGLPSGQSRVAFRESFEDSGSSLPGSGDASGFHMQRIVLAGPQLTLPYWLILIVTSVVPIVWGCRAVRIHRFNRLARLYLGQICPRCGYDLRATPDRCPECGRIPKTSTSLNTTR